MVKLSYGICYILFTTGILNAPDYVLNPERFDTCEAIASEAIAKNISPLIAVSVAWEESRLQKELQIYEKDKLRKYKRFDDLSKKAENKGQLGVAVNAEFRSGQMAEMFVNKSEVKHVGLEGMSREQLEKRLSELEQKIGEAKNIVDVTPEKTASD